MKHPETQFEYSILPMADKMKPLTAVMITNLTLHPK